jgi:hypothetical protein
MTLLKPVLKAPELKRLKLNDDELLSNFAFKFYLRRFYEGQTLRPRSSW